MASAWKENSQGKWAPEPSCFPAEAQWMIRGRLWFQEEVVFFSYNSSASPIQASARQVGSAVEGPGSLSLELASSLTVAGVDLIILLRPASLGVAGWQPNNRIRSVRPSSVRPSPCPAPP